jgi:ABC-2 type transport system permease protein
VGHISIVTPAGYIGLCFLFFILALALFCCSQVAAARHEEAEQRLETLFAQPAARTRWLAGRLALALGGAVAVALAAGLLAWAGATIALVMLGVFALTALLALWVFRRRDLVGP